MTTMPSRCPSDEDHDGNRRLKCDDERTFLLNIPGGCLYGTYSDITRTFPCAPSLTINNTPAWIHHCFSRQSSNRQLLSSTFQPSLRPTLHSNPPHATIESLCRALVILAHTPVLILPSHAICHLIDGFPCRTDLSRS